VGLGSKRRRLPGEVSGGEKERASIARAIVNHPPVILADEPTGNLDSRNSREVMGLLKELSVEGVTSVMVTHSETCAAFAHRVIRMADGRIAV
jgi:putative ABC transport system ATP-binding protein